MKWLKLTEIQGKEKVDKVEHLTDRADTQYTSLWRNGIVHINMNPETREKTAWVWNAVYVCTITDIGGDYIHLYSDRDGIFGVDSDGYICESAELREPQIHETEE